MFVCVCVCVCGYVWVVCVCGGWEHLSSVLTVVEWHIGSTVSGRRWSRRRMVLGPQQEHSKRLWLFPVLLGGIARSLSGKLCEEWTGIVGIEATPGKANLLPIFWPGPSAEMCRGFFVVWGLEDFARDFPGGFFWALFPAKMRRKIRRENPHKNPAAQKYKSAKTPFCQEPTLKSWINTAPPTHFPRLLLLVSLRPRCRLPEFSLMSPGGSWRGGGLCKAPSYILLWAEISDQQCELKSGTKRRTNSDKWAMH